MGQRFSAAFRPATHSNFDGQETKIDFLDHVHSVETNNKTRETGAISLLAFETG
jgi:hypothetical protein